MLHPRSQILGAVSLSCVLATAQLPIGVPTPGNGRTPVLASEAFWPGNGTFAWHVQDAAPGGFCLLLASAVRRDQTLLGLTVYPGTAPGEVLLATGGLADAQGRFDLPMPLPPAPPLVGMQLWAQCATTDPTAPNVLAASQGLQLEATLPPLLAVGVPGDQLLLADAVLGTTRQLGGLASPSFRGFAFGDGGRDLFVAANPGGVYVFDTTQPSPTATQLYPFFANAIALDTVHRQLWIAGTFPPELVALDVRRGSPNFGRVTARLTPVVDSLAISADGRRLLLCSGTGDLSRIDSDPSSPNFAQPIATAARPFAFGFGDLVDPVLLTPDGSVATVVHHVALPTPRTQLHRCDLAHNQWLDHDPATPGIQPLSGAVAPQLAGTFRVVPTRDGRRLFATTARGVFELRGLDRLPVPTLAPSPIALASTESILALSPTGRFATVLTQAPAGTTTPEHYSLVDTATGARIPWFDLPNSNGAGAAARWR